MFKILLQILTKFDMYIVHVCAWYAYRNTLVHAAQSCREKERKKSPVVTWSHVTWSHGPHSIYNQYYVLSSRSSVEYVTTHLHVKQPTIMT